MKKMHTEENGWYGLLVMFKRGEKISRSTLINQWHFLPEKIDEALKMNYIAQVSTNYYDEPLYSITGLGIEVRER